MFSEVAKLWTHFIPTGETAIFKIWLLKNPGVKKNYWKAWIYFVLIILYVLILYWSFCWFGIVWCFLTLLLLNYHFPNVRKLMDVTLLKIFYLSLEWIFFSLFYPWFPDLFFFYSVSSILKALPVIVVGSLHHRMKISSLNCDNDIRTSGENPNLLHFLTFSRWIIQCVNYINKCIQKLC